MTRGNAAQVKVHYKGSQEDFIVLVDSVEAVQEWKKDSSVPLAQVVAGFKVFTTHKQGAQGIMDAASNQSLESEFDTTKQEDVIKIILQKGDVQDTQNSERQGDRNVSQGTMGAH